MKITCTVEHLQNAVLTTERFTGRHVTLPIISHLLLIVRDKKISLNATNLEIGIEYTIPGKIQRVGLVTAPAKPLSQLLQSFSKDENLTLEVTGDRLTLQTSESEVTILGLNPSDFPALPTIKRESGFRMESDIFSRALAQVFPAAATNDLKPALAGVRLATEPKTLVLTGTDSFRLAERTISNQETITTTFECIIPARMIQELIRILPAEGEIEVLVGEHQILFQWESVRVLSRLIDDAYPPYQKLIPKSYESTVAVKREELLGRIHLASVFSSRLNDVTLRYAPGELEVSTTNAETGTATGRLPARGRGAAGTVVFNYHYLLDGLAACGGDEVTMSLNGVSGPALIQNPHDPSFFYLLMPIRSV